MAPPAASGCRRSRSPSSTAPRLSPLPAPSKSAAVCLAEGADHAIAYHDGFRDKVLELTGGRGVDIIYDPVNGPTFDKSLRCLAWSGRILILGFLGGAPR